VQRYFFNFHDGVHFTDDIGSEHPDIESARAEAVESLAERMVGNLLKGKDVTAWLMNVTDEAGLTVLIVNVSAAAVQVVTKALPSPDPAFTT
jgi:hypothetical protein